MSENMIFWFCLLVAILGVLALGSILFFGILLSRQLLGKRIPYPEFFEWFMNRSTSDKRYIEQMPRYLSDAYAEYLQRRNEFWTTYGQIVIATLVIVVLSILLLTKTISAEAGLPVLSGVSGFAIAKGVSGGRSVSTGPDTKQM